MPKDETMRGTNEPSTGYDPDARILIIAELVLLAAWTIFVTRIFLNLDPTVIPPGNEYLSSIQTHHLWTRWQQCGLCALWDGSERGGAPAFADVHGSMLHPLVILATLGWGVVNGSKFALVGAFFMAGLAQWWLGYTLKLNPLARIWGGGMAIVAGNLAGRLELGAFGVVLSTAACALVLPPLIALNLTGTRRAAVGLGIVLALALVAGQGYMQVGLMFALPSALLLLPDDRASRIRLARRYALAIGVAVLLAAPFLVPYLHFLPEFVKATDPEFRSAQPFAFVPLNLVIDDYQFYMSDQLHKFPYPHLYVNYIGWIPVLLAVWACFGNSDTGQRRVIHFFIVLSVLSLWIASAEPLRLFLQFVPIPWLSEQIAGIRHPPQIAGLAVPALLGLSAIGIDRLLARAWPQIHIEIKSRQGAHVVGFDSILLMIIPLTAALISAQAFASTWIRTVPVGSEIRPLLTALQTPDLQWVNPPFGEHQYIESAVAMGLKMSFGIRTWNWRDHDLPQAVLEANRAGPPPGMTEQTVVDGIPIYATPPGWEYATVTHPDGSQTVCEAHGIGGDIDVACDLVQPGLLLVFENTWDGWSARSNGQQLVLQSGQWLSVELPLGKQTIQFRYRPWDVPLGFLMCAAGIILAGYVLRSAGSNESN
jgi:hypothetical protein